MNQQPLTVGSLFSGIGGIDLGLERAGFTVKWQCENNPWARRVLAKHWANVPCYDDIQALDAETVEPVDMLAGGFPCQDLSAAGKRAGLQKGTRSGLWFEFARLIRALRPRYILVENVTGLLTNHAMGRVLGDLAESGYHAEWQVLSARAFGANHLRKRVWIVAYADNCGELQSQRGVFDFGGRIGNGCSQTWTQWPAEPDVGRVAHGIPKRVDRLRGLGNAVVPQVVEWIGHQILIFHNATYHIPKKEGTHVQKTF